MSAKSTELAGRLIIICGLPGSGKTTLAKRLEIDHRAVRFCPDDWMADLGIDLFDAVMRAKVEQLQWQLTKRLLELQQVVIIEWGTWGRDERDCLREGARAQGAAVELRYLDASVDVVWERIRDRDMEFRLGGRRLTRADIESYSATFERPDTDELAVYDKPVTPR